MGHDKTQLATLSDKVLLSNHIVSRALSEGQFVPFFQPLIDLRTGELAGFEVLARLRHPSVGLIPPDRFITLAEQDGWIEELTRQVLRKAFEAAAAIPHPLMLAINISPLQLRDTRLPQQVAGLAATTGFPLSRLVVEITESGLIEDPQHAATVVAELKSMGCRLALDDFGTGYSSLAHLQALPFDKLKVDRSFVSSMTERRQSRKIVAAVVGLGQSLGLTTVAEGIESREQAEMMLWLGCDLGQGYFFGRPIPADELFACVAAHRAKVLIPRRKAWKGDFAAHLDSCPTQRLAQLQAVYEGAPVGLAFLDKNMRYVNLNQKLADMNGASIEDHLGATAAEMVPDLFPQAEPYIRRALNGEAVMDVEVNLPNGAQTRLISYQPVRDEAGEVLGVSLAVVDITDRKRAERALEQSEAHYRRLVAQNPQVLWIMHPQGNGAEVSAESEKAAFVRSRTRALDWLKSVHPADMQPTVQAIAAAMRNRTDIDVSYRVSDGAGRWLTKRSRGAPRFDERGNIVCWFGSVQDMGSCSDSNEPVSALRPAVPRVSTPETVLPGLAAPALDASAKLRRHQVLHPAGVGVSQRAVEFDDLVALAAQVCDAPISLVSLIDPERQWIKAAVGLSVLETPITSSFSTHTIAQQKVLVVMDATKDPRFKHHPFVIGSPGVRFYAGLPLYGGDTTAIGTLCVMDTVPRTLTDKQAKALVLLGHQAEARLKLGFERVRHAREPRKPRALAPALEVTQEILTEPPPGAKRLFA